MHKCFVWSYFLIEAINYNKKNNIFFISNINFNHTKLPINDLWFFVHFYIESKYCNSIEVFQKPIFCMCRIISMVIINTIISFLTWVHYILLLFIWIGMKMFFHINESNLNLIFGNWWIHILLYEVLKEAIQLWRLSIISIILSLKDLSIVLPLLPHLYLWLEYKF